MFKPNSLIIYVDDVEKSRKFYQKIFKSDPLETFEEFVVFPLTADCVLGIQSKSGIEPKPQPQFGGFEICMADVTKEEVDSLYQEWKAQGVEFELEPITLEFGYTFVARDPDGHRLRVCATDTTNVN